MSSLQHPLFRFFVRGGAKDVLRWASRQPSSQAFVFAPVAEHKDDFKPYLSTLDALANGVSDLPNKNHKICVKLSALGFSQEKEIDALMKAYPSTTWTFDAEQSKTRGAYSSIVNPLIENHGLRVEKVYQAYLTHSMNELIKDANQFYPTLFRARIVRGAYLREEPKGVVYESKDECNLSFDSLLRLSLFHTYPTTMATQNIESFEKWSHYTNLETSTLLGFPTSGSTHSSIYVPFGSIADTLPYLSRRLYTYLTT